MTELASERWSWTVGSYEQAAAGVFGDAPRVELLDRLRAERLGVEIPVDDALPARA